MYALLWYHQYAGRHMLLCESFEDAVEAAEDMENRGEGSVDHIEYNGAFHPVTEDYRYGTIDSSMLTADKLSSFSISVERAVLDKRVMFMLSGTPQKQWYTRARDFRAARRQYRRFLKEQKNG